jgi:hypothetical protein
MRFINFPESNKVMGSGGNENTSAIRVMHCSHPEYSDKTEFFVGKLSFDGNERYKIARMLADYVLEKNSIKLSDAVIESIKEAIPDIWFNSMHGFMPTLITLDPPWSMGYKKIIKPSATDN